MPHDGTMPHLWGINTLHELRRQMVSGSVQNETKDTHHRLPRSRGGQFQKKRERKERERNEICINRARHRLWHKLSFNKIGTEIAAQFNMWLECGQIGQGQPRYKFACSHKHPATRGRYIRWFFNKVLGAFEPTDNMKMTTAQALAWRDLFGPNTPLEVICQIINEFLVHPDTPLSLISMETNSR